MGYGVTLWRIDVFRWRILSNAHRLKLCAGRSGFCFARQVCVDGVTCVPEPVIISRCWQGFDCKVGQTRAGGTFRDCG